MDFSEQNITCRLCLMKLTENCEPIEEILRHTLNFLTLCPNLAISDDPMICETCAMNLKKCFDFKSKCLSTEDCIASFVEGENKKVNLRNIYSKVKLNGNIDRFPDDHSVCRFCLQLLKDDAAMYIRHDIDIVDILQKYFLEMDLRITDDIIACTPCYNSLQFHVTFVNKYLSIEEKIDEYCKVEGTNYKDQVDLIDVATFVSKSVLNAKENKHENMVNPNVDIKVKYEDATDVEQEKEKLFDREIQQSNNNSFQFHSSPSQSDCVPHLTGEIPAKYTCEIFGYQNNRKGHLQAHILAHKGIIQEANYNCEICSFEVKTKGYAKKHMLKHKDPSEVTMYRCTMCSYQGKCKNHLQVPMLTHKDDTEVTLYKCDLCNYDTKWKYGLKKHMINHKPISEVTMYKCETCAYKTKWKSTLKRHMLTHKTHSEISKSEVTMYRCTMCSYQGKRKNLQSHMITHKDDTEVTKYKCYQCNFETKWRSCIRSHMLIHKTDSETTMYKCYHCNYEGKEKSSLKRHMLTHKTPSETTMYRCETCDFETKHKDYLKQHMLIHLDVSKIEMHKCEVCPFETKWKKQLRKHLLCHRNTQDI